MPPRQPHDPFSNAPLRPASSNPSLRDRQSQQSLRSNASSTSARSRQQRDLLAPSRSRRPISRAAQRVADEVLEDPESGENAGQSPSRSTRQGQGSPDLRHGRSRARQQQDVEPDIVNRQADGGYLIGISAANDGLRSTMLPQSMVESEEEAAKDAYYAAMARQYFASGIAVQGRGSKKPQEDLEGEAHNASMRMRELARQKLDEERWMFEPQDRFHAHFS
ncbi:hypothetical protein BAUCODRAFT_138665 [Baudoinia panamericana UAMH 10762]|uniref:Uncharacterized protein n=1 Tax=Baudoinia panamericana (strain UAMH 10762) TaxID=717646 RepID=M2LSA6_BAUPA|nr:uncharacterized protein BAUCODRAFT_138665 [Baudoinia panamericana UAMH 10762]EMC97357.1 hypothetical protein BAUCODRAFT_138665 [Baudoinia panamericana UAMH 10762]